jgi:hypothetical protein
MTETTSTKGVGSTVPRQSSRSTATPSVWFGWIIFAGTMLVLVGTMHIIQGLVAIFNDEYYAVAKSGLVVHADFTAWGWTHIIGGCIIIAAGLGLFAGQMWARVVGVILASLSVLVSFGFLAAEPVWSAIVIALDVFIILALTVHGNVKDA